MPPRHLRTALALPLGLMLVLGAAGCKGKEPPQATEAPAVLTVSTQPVATRQIERTLSLTGSVAAWEQLPIMPAANGLKIVEVLAEEGDMVQQGQLLAKLDDATLRAQLAQAKARLATARAQRASAEDLYQRFAALAEEGGVSASDLFARRTAVETSAAQVAEAEAAISNFEALLAQTRVTAPTAGLVLKRDALLGDVSTVGRALFTLARDQRLEVEALVPETDLGRVKPGQPVKVTSDARPGLEATGTVRQISPSLDASSRQATVEIDLPKGSDFQPGMFVRAALDLGSQEAIAVPANAVIAKEGGSEVFVLDGEIARARKVTTGAREGDWVAVLEGLKRGETLITAGAGFLKDGDKVDVAPAIGSRIPASEAQP